MTHDLLDGKAARDEVKSSPQLYLLHKVMRLRRWVISCVGYDRGGAEGGGSVEGAPVDCSVSLHGSVHLSPSSAGSLAEGDAEGTLRKALESVLTHNARSSTSGARRGRQTAAGMEMEVPPAARWAG